MKRFTRRIEDGRETNAGEIDPICALHGEIKEYFQFLSGSEIPAFSLEETEHERGNARKRYWLSMPSSTKEMRTTATAMGLTFVMLDRGTGAGDLILPRSTNQTNVSKIRQIIYSDSRFLNRRSGSAATDDQPADAGDAASPREESTADFLDRIGREARVARFTSQR